MDVTFTAYKYPYTTFEELNLGDAFIVNRQLYIKAGLEAHEFSMANDMVCGIEMVSGEAYKFKPSDIVYKAVTNLTYSYEQ